jgi:5-methylcytosine-specific restriction enzyme subunit McrC
VTTLLFREYDTTSGVTLTPRQAELLRRRFGCQVTLADTSGQRYDVRPRELVGTLIDPDTDTTIAVRPKLAIARVLFLLAHAADPDWQDDATLTEADSLTDAVVMLYAALCDRALRNGILRGYRDRDARLHTVRGRIDFTEQLRTTPGRDLPLAVSYQDHDEDILENRLLQAALLAVSALPVHTDTTRRSLTRLRRALACVTPIRYDRRRPPTVLWTRLNRHYRPAVELAQLILTGTEADLDAGDIRAPGLIINMTTVFERFVRNTVRHALDLTEQEFPTGTDTPSLPLDDARRLTVQPDLSRWVDGRCRFVGELKYRYDTGHGAAPNLYQTLAYAIAADLPHATLIYADGATSRTTHHLPHAGVRIHVRHLDLNTHPTDLLHQIRTLADHINTLTTPAQTRTAGS